MYIVHVYMCIFKSYLGVYIYIMYIDIHVNLSIYTYMFEGEGASTKKGEQQFLCCLFCKKKGSKIYWS